MRAWKLTLFLLFVLSIAACSPKPADQPETTAPATDTASTPAAPAEPTPAPTPEPAAPPAPATKAAPKPVAKATPPQPPAASAPAPSRDSESALTASRDRDVTPAPAPKKPEPVIVPSGTELNIVLSDALNSGKVKPGDTFEASLAAPVYVNGVEVLNRGAKVEGTVVAAEGAGRVSGKASMTLTLTSIRDGSKSLTVSTKDLAAEAESTTGRDVKVIGGSAGVGAIIGAIAGGKKGAATGAAIGGAAGTGTVLATKGKEVEYPAESKLTFILDRDLRL